MNRLDLIIALGITGISAALIYIIWGYIKGLRACPRELYILFISKILEYSAYGGMNMAFVLFLSADCGLSDIAAGTYVGTWSTLLTVCTILVGAIVDAIGIKRTLVFGTVVLLFSRFFFPLFTNLTFVTILGFAPLAIGMAMLGPVLSVGIKKYTSKETVTLGFALFYTLMNVGWAIAAWIFDKVRVTFGEHNIIRYQLTSYPSFGLEFSTYQIIFLVSFFLTIPMLFILLTMRDGVEMTEDKGIIINPKKFSDEEKFFIALKSVIKKGGADTVKIFKSVIKEKAFWYFLFTLGILVFVRLVFFHWHYTFPKYANRVLGEGLKIGSIYGVLNPVMIVLLTPFFAVITKKISSYKIMLFGSFISSLAVFIGSIPERYFTPLMNSWFSELIFVRWLNIPENLQRPMFLALVLLVAIFTIGEALWSPRLMQYTAEIAPKGREGSYIALSYLPFFAGKLIAGPLSGWLLTTYTPANPVDTLNPYPYHYLVWVWIGGMALISPFGLIIFKKLFTVKEKKDG